MKLKVGSEDSRRDIRRAALVRDIVGSDIKLMVDCHQQWTLPKALRVCLELMPMSLYWVEEPTLNVTPHVASPNRAPNRA
ncbi:MAG: enolase C-terminal domain-like protein [Chloroflexota bacterium]|nr:enolase C-terminal domain-like protein [Chloroflexota bacterium]